MVQEWEFLDIRLGMMDSTDLGMRLHWSGNEIPLIWEWDFTDLGMRFHWSGNDILLIWEWGFIMYFTHHSRSSLPNLGVRSLAFSHLQWAWPALTKLLLQLGNGGQPGSWIFLAKRLSSCSVRFSRYNWFYLLLHCRCMVFKWVLLFRLWFGCQGISCQGLGCLSRQSEE